MVIVELDGYKYKVHGKYDDCYQAAAMLHRPPSAWLGCGSVIPAVSTTSRQLRAMKSLSGTG